MLSARQSHPWICHTRRREGSSGNFISRHGTKQSGSPRCFLMITLRREVNNGSVMPYFYTRDVKEARLDNGRARMKKRPRHVISTQDTSFEWNASTVDSSRRAIAPASAIVSSPFFCLCFHVRVHFKHVTLHQGMQYLGTYGTLPYQVRALLGLQHWLCSETNSV